MIVDAYIESLDWFYIYIYINIDILTYIYIGFTYIYMLICYNPLIYWFYIWLNGFYLLADSARYHPNRIPLRRRTAVQQAGAVKGGEADSPRSKKKRAIETMVDVRDLHLPSKH